MVAVFRSKLSCGGLLRQVCDCISACETVCKEKCRVAVLLPVGIDLQCIVQVGLRIHQCLQDALWGVAFGCRALAGPDLFCSGLCR